MNLRIALPAALMALPLLAAAPPVRSHSGGIDVRIGLGTVIVNPPVFGRIEIGHPVRIHRRADRTHYHGPRLCRIDHRHRLHTHDHRGYDRF